MKPSVLRRSRVWPVLLLLGGLVPAVLRPAGSFEEIQANPAEWPREVVVTATAVGTVLHGNRSAGRALIGAGRTLAVLQVRTDGVVVRFGRENVLLPVEKTNLLAAATAAAPEPEPPPAPATVAPSPPSVPARAAGEPASPVLAAREAEMAATPPSPVQRELLGKLVQLENGTLRPYDLRRLNGVKFYGIMFSAGWCGPCRAFAPHLLESYRSLRRIYPEFELVLVSNDRSPADMLAYMREEQMPWPAVKYGEIRQTEALTRLAGPGIPCLVLINSDGKVLADSFDGNNYLGPDSVLDATWRVLQRSRRD